MMTDNVNPEISIPSPRKGDDIVNLEVSDQYDLPLINIFSPQIITEDDIELSQMQGTEFNFDSNDVEEIFQALQQIEAIPLQLKRKLYFLQSDQELFMESVSKYEQAQEYMTDRIMKLEKEVKWQKELLIDKEAEIRIMRRERDDSFQSKLDLNLENKNLKMDLENLHKQQSQITLTTEANSLHHQSQRQQQQIHSEPSHIHTQPQVKEVIGGFFANIFGGTHKEKETHQQPPSQNNRKSSFMAVDKQPNSAREGNSIENEFKSVMRSMNDQIQLKVTENKKLTEQVQQLILEIGKLKGDLALQKENFEDLQIDIEVKESKIRVKLQMQLYAFQKQDEVLAQKEREISQLKQEIQKLRSTSENDLKKIRKAQQSSVPTALNMTTGGSGSGENYGNKNKNMLNQSFDPYKNVKKQGYSLNQSMIQELPSSSNRGYQNSNISLQIFEQSEAIGVLPLGKQQSQILETKRAKKQQLTLQNHNSQGNPINKKENSNSAQFQ